MINLCKEKIEPSLVIDLFAHKMKTLLTLLFFSFAFNGMAQYHYDLIPQLLQTSNPSFFEPYLSHADQYKIQIVYTQIDRDSNNKPSFKDYFYRIEENDYFYPASIVKLPFTIFALEQLQAKVLNTQLKFCYQKDSLSFAQDSLFKKKQCLSIAQYINKALVVSDNQAANTLFELATPSYINYRMKALGFQQSRITQRFAKTDTIMSRLTKPFFLIDSTGKIVYQQREIQWNHVSKAPISPIKIGKGQLLGGKIVNQAFDFSEDNYVALPEIHDLLKKIMVMDSTENGLLLSDTTLHFIRQQLSMYPKECKINTFKPANGYYDACRKYLMFGTNNEVIDTNLRIFNKVGLAYGFVTDIAYIVDYKENIEFMLSAVIYANKDDILNDGKYDYESIAFPFMKNLGKTFFEYEKNRPKKQQAKLSKLQY
jgi:hypothetical protein